MEPDKTHSALLPQQELTQPAGGCPSGPRPEDLMRGGEVGANPLSGQRVANAEYITRLEVYDLLLTKAKELGPKFRPLDLSVKDRRTIFETAFSDIIGPTTEEQNHHISSELSMLISKCEDWYKKCSYKKAHFIKKHNDWLSKPFLENRIPGPDATVNEEISPRTAKFLNLSGRQQARSKRKLETILEKEAPYKLVKCFSETVTQSKSAARDLEVVVNKCLESPSSSSTIINKLNKEQDTFTPEESLALLIDRKFSKDTYCHLRYLLNKKGFPAFPPYSKIQEAKLKCYPKNLLVSETEAHVPLESLLIHTFERLVSLCDTVLSEFCERNALQQLNCTFTGSWGFDGSSGQALYKLRLPNSENELENENCLFATTFIPLQIKTEQASVIWLNPAPQSYRSCRPLHIQYRNETKELILNERKWVGDQIVNLPPIRATTSKGHLVTAQCDLHLTVIDGKVLNVITGTNSQLRCPFCKITSTQFNDLELAYSKPPPEKDLLKFGISPLHAYIRVLEFLLNLSYKNDPRVQGVHRVLKTSEAAAIIAERKKKIQTEIRTRMGLLVDVVKPNAGTTNDGNTARKALSDKHRCTFAEILGIELWLLEDLHTILVALNCGLPIDSKKFGEFCKNVAQKYIETYSWHRMTVTLHKILVHGEEIIQNSVLPMGLLSEQAGEARNKFWRFDREHHCRKSNRISTMTDLFHRALESSDPIISNMRLTDRQARIKRLPLPSAVLTMLKQPDLTLNVDTGSAQMQIEEEDEDLETILSLNENDEPVLTLNVDEENILFEHDFSE